MNELITSDDEIIVTNEFITITLPEPYYYEVFRQIHEKEYDNRIIK